MKYYLFEAGGKEYRLRLTAQSIIEIEKKLRTSIFDVLMKMEGGSFPTLEGLITILHGSMLSLEKGITMNDTYEIYDSYIEGGGDFTGLIEIITEVMRTSGFFRE